MYRTILSKKHKIYAVAFILAMGLCCPAMATTAGIDTTLDASGNANPQYFGLGGQQVGVWSTTGLAVSTPISAASVAASGNVTVGSNIIINGATEPFSAQSADTVAILKDIAPCATGQALSKTGQNSFACVGVSIGSSASGTPGATTGVALPDYNNMQLVPGDLRPGAGTRIVSCPTGQIRTSCGYHTSSTDGKSLITNNPVMPVTPNGCSLSTQENVDPWAVDAYCAAVADPSNVPPDLSNMTIALGKPTVGQGTRQIFCPSGQRRISCGYYTNSTDGKSLITNNPVMPVAPNGCSLSTLEHVDAWAVTAYCAP